MEQQTEKRLAEMAQRSWNRGIPCYTDFLDLSEQSALARIRKQLPPVPVLLFGGAEGCERRMAGFGAEDASGFPVACLRITPSGAKFGEPLGHRDVLGSLMSLGFDRSLLGDIVLREDGIWLFCTERIAGFIEENLLSIRKTTVHCRRADAPPEGELYHLRRQVVQVASPRLDALVAHAFHLSRGEAQSLFPSGRVFLDGAECARTDAEPAAGQIVSVRGMGRFRFLELASQSKKGKWNAVLGIYE